MKTLLRALVALPLTFALVGCDDMSDPEIQELVAEAELEDAFEAELIVVDIDPAQLDDATYEDAFALYRATHDAGDTPVAPDAVDLAIRRSTHDGDDNTPAADADDLADGSIIVEPPCIAWGCARPVASQDFAGS